MTASTAISAAMPLRQFLVDLYAPRHKLRPGTLHQYLVAVDSLDNWHGQPVRLCDLTSEMAIAWLAYLQTRRLARITIKNRRRHLLTLWMGAYRCALVELVPVVPVLGKPRSKPRPTEEPPAALAADMPLADYVHHYASQRGIVQKSVYQFQVAVNSLNRWSGEPLRLCDLTDELFNDWLEHILGEDSAPTTIRGRRTHALALWNAAWRAGLVPQKARNVRPVRCPWQPPVAWPHAEVCELLRAAECLRGHTPSQRWLRSRVGSVERSTFWSLIVRVAWDTGLRLSDILTLTRGQVANDGTIQLVQSKTRRWHGARLHAGTLEAIAKRSLGAGELLFRWPSSREYFGREFREIVRLAGIPAGSFKKLRKSSASDVEMRYPGCGAAHLGHVVAKDIARNHYLDPRLTLATKPMPLALCTSTHQQREGG
ncbi:MAG TPA: tyrosine-type recombinase/integrase, partial [Pirellulales bacterium]